MKANDGGEENETCSTAAKMLRLILVLLLFFLINYNFDPILSCKRFEQTFDTLIILVGFFCWFDSLLAFIVCRKSFYFHVFNLNTFGLFCYTTIILL